MAQLPPDGEWIDGSVVLFHCLPVSWISFLKTGRGQMSELTRCNFCTLQKIRQRGEREGWTVELQRDDDGWIEIQRVGKPSHAGQLGHSVTIGLFRALTDHCVC